MISLMTLRVLWPFFLFGLLCVGSSSDFDINSFSLNGAESEGIWGVNRESDYSKLMGGDILGQTSEQKLMGALCLESCGKWPKTPGTNSYEIPYVFQSDFSKKSRDLIRWVMDYIESGTDIRFVRLEDQMDYLVFVRRNQCSSYVGKKRGAQTVTLADPGCMTPGTILHELSHALGLQHEHQRLDRDDYVDVKFRNVQESAKSEVSILFKRVDRNQVTPYDYASIMHYDRKAFSSNGLPVLEPKDPAYRTMLEKNRMMYSSCDWYALYALYPKKEGASIRCIPNVAGRGLEPTPKCLSEYSLEECDWACTVASQDFWKIGYCQIIGGKLLPPPPWQLTYPESGDDEDPDGSIGEILAEMKGATFHSGVRWGTIIAFWIGLGLLN